mgnify:CR=1 FL=1
MYPITHREEMSGGTVVLNEIQAPQSGTVISIHVKKGDSVAPDETLIEIQCAE